MYIIIVNSNSGRARYRQLAKYLTSYDRVSFVPYFTDEYQEKELWNQVSTHIKSTKRTIEGVIIVGGDGTLHQAINHLHRFQLPFGLIPAGSGNDLAKALKIPTNEKKAFARIKQGLPNTYDLIMINNQYIHSVAGMGVDAETAVKSNHSPLKPLLNRAFLGKLTYLLTFFTVIRTFQPFEAEFTFDNDEKVTLDRVWLLAAGNTPYYGGGIPICPKANPQDGLLEVIVVNRLSLFALLLVLPTVYFKLHCKLPYVHRFETNSFSVKTNSPVLIQGDGEKIGYTPQEISIQRKSIEIF
ncbi:hypothetical protein CR194_03310 [Salipaludibacillus keqinensis]|uniref:DAGKc domain-containing protein n=1 Tax=Salipaludibacillus keqinensis TaxID=2045207 RepID=A0A323TKF5_9BACI|nr:YegS/Rv2252/BmrU family lipid kinase [Salipaludibacillus keqinensis]PYZ94576.1 hypothetical protein CR194_03310 [Salipaludibacillus keqinensis]